jgi:hypothetical protein
MSTITVPEPATLQPLPESYRAAVVRAFRSPLKVESVPTI